MFEILRYLLYNPLTGAILLVLVQLPCDSNAWEVTKLCCRKLAV